MIHFCTIYISRDVVTPEEILNIDEIYNVSRRLAIMEVYGTFLSVCAVDNKTKLAVSTQLTKI